MISSSVQMDNNHKPEDSPLVRKLMIPLSRLSGSTLPISAFLERGGKHFGPGSPRS